MPCRISCLRCVRHGMLEGGRSSARAAVDLGWNPSKAVVPGTRRASARVMSGSNDMINMGNVEGDFGNSDAPVILFDVMDTVVKDPFFEHMPKHFGLTFRQLLEEKHPTAWIDFEMGKIGEEELVSSFFSDGRRVDGEALVHMMQEAYQYVEGMEELLGALQVAGYDMHVFSNYPVWYRYIEEKLELSRYLKWTFVSCVGPMQGLRKPTEECYRAVISHLGLPPERILFVDDRQQNIDGAMKSGMRGIRFTGAENLRVELQKYGISDALQ